MLLLAAALVLAAAAGAAAGEILGRPAPATVRRDIANVDQGMPADLRLNPDVQDARLAAVADEAASTPRPWPTVGTASRSSLSPMGLEERSAHLAPRLGASPSRSLPHSPTPSPRAPPSSSEVA